VASGWPPAPVWPLTPIGPFRGRTLHVGTPGDAEAKIPLTRQDVSAYVRTRPADRRPHQVVVYRQIDDGPAWADDLGLSVHAPVTLSG
jgi:hypothetical protein